MHNVQICQIDVFLHAEQVLFLYFSKMLIVLLLLMIFNFFMAAILDLKWPFFNQKITIFYWYNFRFRCKIAFCFRFGLYEVWNSSPLISYLKLFFLSIFKKFAFLKSHYFANFSGIFSKLVHRCKFSFWKSFVFDVCQKYW